MIYNSGLILKFEDATEALVGYFDLPPIREFKEVVIIEGFSIFDLANLYYRDTRYWYIIAEVNPDLDIMNPLVGSIIKIPLLA